MQSRFYDPEIGRFINADGCVATGQSFIGNNMFAYCGNNPVIRADPSGHSWLAVLLLAGAAALILSGCGNQTAPPSSVPPTTAPPATIPPTTAPANGYDDFLDALAMSESTGNQSAVNEYGYQGLYQMGFLALQDAGFKNSAGDWTDLAKSHGVYSDNDFLKNPTAQKVAVTNYHKKICGYIRHYGMEKYIGTSYQGVTVTYSGLLAACHLVGSRGMADALKTGAIIKDGNGTPASSYLSLFAGYNISEVWD